MAARVPDPGDPQRTGRSPGPGGEPGPYGEPDGAPGSAVPSEANDDSRVAAAPAPARVPDVAIRRLPVYLRALEELRAEDHEIVSSADLAARTGYSSEQIRKDLAYFGAFGTRGVGYRCDVLVDRLRHILGLDREVPIALVGAGHLGTALVRYNRTRHRDVRIVAVFDSDPGRIGQEIEGLVIQPAEAMEAVIREAGIKLAVIAVPAAAAQEVARRLVEAGVTAILNFAPVSLQVPPGVVVQNVDLTLELQSLAYYIRPEPATG
ncbi:redox-sensing transcriptional repressor Rex [Thermaerobacter composti]|uniref:Redox-sensing transcriptional repressor Rex n=1 Tax=Thermaerobacter composti TaxID=554949 RepID=A0ABZ0QQI0_9FIRM|nr:redox-sensing transcriptional repressor Rex [Thermaerobacter composti]PZN08183.1 MAG: redox-sensing transcriptional repressor Rex [Bacillota bacterium]WPD19283.1 redox-sensing transcriptional repressor Rex [Thermaerobacter composti]